MYEMALELGSSVRQEASDVRLKLAEALVRAGRGQDAAQRFLEAAKLAGTVDALELRRRAAEQLLFSGRIEEGFAVVKQLLEATKMRVPQTPLGAVLSLLFRRLLLRLRGLRFRERSADQLPRDRLVRIDTCYSLGLGLGLIDPIRGADFQTRYLLLALAAGEPVRIAKAFALEAAYRATDGAQARPLLDRLLDRARALAERLGEGHAKAMTTLMTGVSRVVLGDLADAVPLCDRAASELRDGSTGVAWELDNAALFAGYALLGCGRIRELAERLPALIDDANERGDHFGEIVLRLQCRWFVRLADDDVEGAKKDLAMIGETWNKDAFVVQHVWCILNRTEVALYEGDPAGATAILEGARTDLERSMFLRIEAFRVRFANATGRAALAVAAKADGAARAEHLGRAKRCVAALRRERWALTRGYRVLLEAGIAALSGGDAASGYRGAIAELDARHLGLHAAAARLRLGELIGGAEGEALVKRANEEMSAEWVRDPEKMSRLFAPAIVAT
jgi:hypothetical protein